jgi:hypothetical protein
MTTPVSAPTRQTLTIGGHDFATSRPHDFGLVIHGLADPASVDSQSAADYLHQLLLSPPHREVFLDLIETEGLVVCKNVETDDPTYRRVRGKSSSGKLSQAEYYHHDGCSCPTKPRVVEIRLPQQSVGRDIATAIASFADIIPAMLSSIPPKIKNREDVDPSIKQACIDFAKPISARPHPTTWDKIQGRITRLIRKELDAESCRSYFREVDAAANAYVLPWEMQESRLMINNHDDLSKTMQHRRSMQKPKGENEQNGSLVKRWTAEEYPSSQCKL